VKIIKQKDNKAKEHNNGVVNFVSYCFNSLLNTVIDMDKRGVTEEFHQGNLRGKTKKGEDINIKYGYGVKIGLDDFIKSRKPHSHTSHKL
jgi:hypothetical protein